VGPASAGAVPGPACYGRGGVEPTVTDANLLLGRLLEDSPLAGELQLDRAAAERAVAQLGGELGLETIACAEGIVRVAEAEMLAALRVMTVERGIDPRGFALMPFGGAGPLHAAALAREMGIARVLCARASGVLCALGLAAAAPRRDVARTLMLRGRSLSPEGIDRERSALIAEARSDLAGPAVRVRVRHELRYRGQSFELPVEEESQASAGAEAAEAGAWLDPRGICEAFAEAHLQRYGYRDDSAEVELVTMRVSAWGPAPAFAPLARARRRPGAAEHPRSGNGAEARAGSSGAESREIVFSGSALRASVIRGEPEPGSVIEGPALCALPEATLLVPPGWRGEADAHGTIHLRAGAEGA
jgi:N-methylhydantoinase A